MKEKTYHSETHHRDFTVIVMRRRCFLNLSSTKPQRYRGGSCTGDKHSKEQDTVLVATNMTGTESLPLLAIGKSKTRRCFRNVTQLPADTISTRKHG